MMSRLLGINVRQSSMVLRSLQVRGKAKVPATKKTPPTLEEFDPLNPGEWQLGVGGKILPRLPEGTRVGRLVMGKYGLYAPHIKKIQEYCKPRLDAGEKTYIVWMDYAGLDGKRWSNYIYIFAHALLAFGLLLLATVFNEKPFWPFEGFFRFCGVKWEGMDEGKPASD